MDPLPFWSREDATSCVDGDSWVPAVRLGNSRLNLGASQDDFTTFAFDFAPRLTGLRSRQCSKQMHNLEAAVCGLSP